MSRKEEERTLLLTRLLVQIVSKSAKSKINDSIAHNSEKVYLQQNPLYVRSPEIYISA